MVSQCNGFLQQNPFSLLWPSEPAVSEPSLHFSTLDPDKHPINLYQYTNTTVIRIKYDTQDQLVQYLKAIPKDYGIWSKSASAKTIDLQLSTVDYLKLLAKFDDMDYQILVEDLAQTVFETFPENHQETINTEENSEFKETKANVFSELFFKDYRPLETIEAWLDIIQQSFPGVVKVEEIGKTFEGRPYNIVHVSDHSVDDHSEKKTIVINGGIHAREWISVSSVCYQIYSMLNVYMTQPEILQELDFIFVPLSNPDGYEYTWSTDRLWRKNRQTTILPRCYGIDIDHSYDFHWTKSSDWPCGEEYSGEHPYEAVEAQIWEDYLNKTNAHHEIYGYIDLHSYSEEILFPFAYSCSSEPRDEENLIELAYGISKAIRLQSGKFYNVLPACQDKDSDLLPDLGSGTSLDFMYHNKAFWAYQLKLRDTGNHGFLLPPKFIEPVGAEIFAGIQYFIKFITEDD
ncbi:hypothetical protein CANTEDRAFT_112648 [Yamadazyma tenuis ATCC 10573]|uniref:Inactive metallocarboxypeptidase ECM14 n=1 Tax=Candida tenuis (strain ATCC 10573 / BCRC 21748 / CBS 615 / JCM 9827 / NBRC 10315 / NRRL Y-1498 / VKM Y-70) TaxID=590646 RepID=G3AY68_CANTC|nr:uncharacterized protein CANTEDRAFT_112648 [Yamadazyma tenuis ATCC 10573]EGV66177.1 hypothetical protein CANTEDRAFT_112648 [Yamadazyma tenuis ATCC 10573]